MARKNRCLDINNTMRGLLNDIDIDDDDTARILIERLIERGKPRLVRKVCVFISRERSVVNSIMTIDNIKHRQAVANAYVAALKRNPNTVFNDKDIKDRCIHIATRKINYLNRFIEDASRAKNRINNLECNSPEFEFAE